MAFTCSEFPGRTFKSVRELEELRKEKHLLQKRLQENTVRTAVERVDATKVSEHDDKS